MQRISGWVRGWTWGGTRVKGLQRQVTRPGGVGLEDLHGDIAAVKVGSRLCREGQLYCRK